MEDSPLPLHSFQNQIHHFSSQISRTLLISLSVVFFGILIILAAWRHAVALIILDSLLLIGVGYVLWLAVGAKIELSAQGLSYSKFIPFTKNTIPWKSVVRVSPTAAFGHYRIVTSDPDINIIFSTSSIEKYEQLLIGFRANKVFVERKQQSFPAPRHHNYNTLKEDTGSLLYSSLQPKKLASVSNPSLGILIGGFSAVVFTVYFLVSVSYIAPMDVGKGLLNMWISFLFGIVAVWMLEYSLGGYIKIKEDGVDFSNGFGRRNFVLWSDIQFVRILDVQLKYGTRNTYQLFPESPKIVLGPS